MSIIFSPYTIPAGLNEASKFIGGDVRWAYENSMQEKLLKIYGPTVKEEAGFIPEIESIASKDVGEINRFLRERGFNIQLDPIQDPRGFAAAAVLKALLEWETKGGKHPLSTPDGKTYPGVLMKKKVSCFGTGTSHHSVIRIPTKSGDLVYMTVAEKVPADEFELLDKIRQLEERVFFRDHVEVLFPMVDLDIQGNLEWLQGMWTVSEKDQPWFISQALRQTKLRMNEVGVKIEEAIAFSVMRGGPSQTRRVIINEPFLIWATRHTLTLPLFAGYVTPEDWKEPAEL